MSENNPKDLFQEPKKIKEELIKLGIPLDGAEISGLFWLSPENGKSPRFDYEAGWNSPVPENAWPGNQYSGVYFLYDEDGQLNYVGKADVLGARLGQHFSYGSDKTKSVLRDNWPFKPHYLVTIRLERTELWFLNVAIESYAIKKYGKRLINMMGV